MKFKVNIVHEKQQKTSWNEMQEILWTNARIWQNSFKIS